MLGFFHRREEAMGVAVRLDMRHLKVGALDDKRFVFYRCFISEDGGFFIAENPELNILSTGDSVSEAARNLGECIIEYIDFADTEGIADEILPKRRPKMALSTRLEFHFACLINRIKNWFVDSDGFCESSAFRESFPKGHVLNPAG